MLKFRQDRRRWLFWAAAARRRYGLCVLNYIVTSNHIHLLVLDKGLGEIAKSMQLIAGRTAQEYNRRKNRLGAYWQDRYHATAVDTDHHLEACMRYIDLNMVRAGVVSHPADWLESGYGEIQQPHPRYGIIDFQALLSLFESSDLASLQRRLAANVADALHKPLQKEPHWSESLAVGSRTFVDTMQVNLAGRARARSVDRCHDAYVLRDGDPDRTALENSPFFEF